MSIYSNLGTFITFPVSFHKLGKVSTVLVSAGIAAVLELYIVTPIEYITSEASDRLGVVIVLKVAIAAIVAVITILIRKILITLVGRRARF